MVRLLLISMVLMMTTGCVHRRIRVTSEPSGAVVWLNDTEIGRTPAEAEFTFYGSYDVRLEMDGYEPIHEARRTHAPFYEYPGPDLVAEILPMQFDSLIKWHFDLMPTLEKSAPIEEMEADLIERARRLRRQTEQGDTNAEDESD